jgi:protein-tyrosine phosphatase
VRLCFVCLGNICRSPTAEGVMARLVRDAGLDARVALDSAGTGSWHVGELADPRTRTAARARGIELVHRARQFVAADFARFDLVLAMDRSNQSTLVRMRGGAASGGAASGGAASGSAEVRLLRSFDPTAPSGAEVPDPYAGGPDGFEEVLDQCERACRGLLAHVRASLVA